MTTFCHPLPPSIGQEMLQVAAKAICDHPGDPPFLRDSRTRQMVHSVMGFEPRDGQEIMHATLIVGHYHLILNAMREVFQGQIDTMKARTKSGIVSLDRAMLGFGRDMRALQRRPVARGAEEASSLGPVEIAEWVADWAGMPPAARAPETTAAQPVVTAGSRPVETAVAPPVRTEAITPAPVATARTATAQSGAKPSETTRPPATSPFAEAIRIAGGPIDPAPRPIAAVSAGANRSALMSGSAHFPPNDVDDETLRHIADFEAALAALTETLEEARALDAVGSGTKAASGD